MILLFCCCWWWCCSVVSKNPKWGVNFSLFSSIMMFVWGNRSCNAMDLYLSSAPVWNLMPWCLNGFVNQLYTLMSTLRSTLAPCWRRSNSPLLDQENERIIIQQITTHSFEGSPNTFDFPASRDTVYANGGFYFTSHWNLILSLSAPTRLEISQGIEKDGD